MFFKPHKKIAHCIQWQAISQYPLSANSSKIACICRAAGPVFAANDQYLGGSLQGSALQLGRFKGAKWWLGLLLVTSKLASCQPVQWDLDFWTFLNCFATLSWHLLPYKCRIDLSLSHLLPCMFGLSGIWWSEIQAQHMLVTCMTTLRHLGSQHSDGGL